MSAEQPIDLLSDSDDEVEVVVVEKVARAPIVLEADDDIEIDTVGFKETSMPSGNGKRKRKRSHMNVAARAGDRELPGKKHAASVEIVREITTLDQVIEVFPDVHPDHAAILLQQHGNKVPVVLNVLAESSYPKTKIDKSKQQDDNDVVLEREENQKQYKYDYMSPSSFDPSKEYMVEAMELLLADFPFLSKYGARKYLKDAKNHYAICHQNICNAIMLRNGSEPDDEAEQYTQFVMLKNARLGGGVNKRQLTALALPEARRPLVLRQPRINPKSPEVKHPILMDEHEYVKDKFSQWTERMENHKARMRARERATKDHKLIECGCCYSSVAKEETIACHQKQHRFCVDCIKQYAESQMFGSGNLGLDSKTKEPATDLLCMHVDGCTSGFPPLALKMALPEKVLRKYNELQFQAAVSKAGIEDVVTCPKCSFLAVVPETQMIFKCPLSDCRYEACRKCGEEPHIPLRCEEVEKKHETKGRLRVEEAISEAKIRSCPKCARKFVKEFGCNKMTCACGTNVCYICRKDISKVGYQHFCQKPHCNHKNCGRCALSTNAEQDDERAMREAGLKAAEQVQKESKRDEAVSVDVDAILQRPQSNAPRAMFLGQMNPVVPFAQHLHGLPRFG